MITNIINIGSGASGDFIPNAEKGAANGVATLDANQLIPSVQLPPIAISDTFPVASEAEMLALDAQTGDVAVRADISESFILQGSDPSVLVNWIELLTPTDAVQSVNGKVGVVSLNSTDIGLGNVDNTSDVNKPISTATQTALNGKATSAQGALADSALQTGSNISALLNDSGYITSAPVDSVNGKTGPVTLDKTDIGLTNVDNTSDVNKPVSTATQTALDGKATSAQGALADSALQTGSNISALLNDVGYITSAPVDSVNGKIGPVVLDKTDIGLTNVDNTSDVNKPISTATQAALDGKPISSNDGAVVVTAPVSRLTNSLAIGDGADSYFNSLAIGHSATTVLPNSTVVGCDASATNRNTVVVGRSASAALNSTAVGYSAIVSGSTSNAIGSLLNNAEAAVTYIGWNTDYWRMSHSGILSYEGTGGDGQVVIPPHTTAARPTPHDIGAHTFDTTLGIPIWWDGTNWVDATGTTV